MLVRGISPNFTEALANYFGSGPTNLEASRVAHEDFVSALLENGLEIIELPPLSQHPDCCFVEDTAVIVGSKALICNLGHPSRKGEIEGVRDALGEFFELIDMPEGASLDGGDVIFYDGTYLIGRSTRTNDAGVEFLSELCVSENFATHVFDIPPSTLHLSTVCSSPRPGTLVTAEGHLTPEQFEGLEAEIVWIPNDESYAANTIGFADGSVIISADYPVTKATMEELGFTIREVNMEHIRAADGSLTCLKVFID